MLSRLSRRLVALVLSAALTSLVWSGQTVGATAPNDPGPVEPRPFPDDYGPNPAACFSPLRLPSEASAGEPHLVLNVAARQLYVYSERALTAVYPTAVGRLGHHTPTGRYSILGKACGPTWYPTDGRPPVPPGPLNPLGTRWMGWSWSGYGLHGTNADWSIGQAVSLGCVRLHNSDAERVFDLVRIGTPLEVVYEPVELAILRDDGGEPDNGGELGHGGELGPAGLVLTLFPDVYGRVPDYAAFLESRLALAGWALPAETVTWLLWALAGHEAVGLDTVSLVLLGSRLVDTPIVRLGRPPDDAPLVAARAVAEALGRSAGWDQASGQATVDGIPVPTVIMGGRAFARLEDLAAASGTNLDSTWEAVEPDAPVQVAPPSSLGSNLFLRYRLAIFPGLVYVDGCVISRQAFRRGDGTYVPLRTVAETLGLPLQWEPSTGMVIFGGGPVPVLIDDGRSFIRDEDLAAALTGLATLQVTADGVFIGR